MEDKDMTYILECVVLMVNRVTDEELKGMSFTDSHIAKARYIYNHLRSMK